MNNRYWPVKPLLHYIVILALLFCMLMANSSEAINAAVINHKLPNLPEISVVTEYLAPYQIKNSDGSLGGMATEIMHALFSQLGEQPIVHVMPWPRAYAMAKNNKNTLIFSIAHTPARSKQFQWVGRIMEEKLYFWSLKNTFNQPITEIKQLENYRVAASRHSNVAQYLLDNAFSKVSQVTKEDQNMLMLYKNRVDLIVATEFTLQKRALKLGLDFQQLKPLIEVKALNNDLSFAFSHNTSAEIVAHFKAAYKQLEQQGIIEQIKHKWGVIH